ncbi:Glycosyltransferase involved in cell wall bisynthesis [Vreelandella subterranea]|uniref:Glycosyltransferase involved in cell wall bisynthesis n=1 Tax=Vreelandella subterranea TaxID=416874 RepID=A0A1H9RT66_9GAMM|nr:glycosyltransferase family 4 protein [Halomonas subterranea]SER75333.1 Glycosyltransferase involved in cell wall bisynthesis [Halomonas subterranea]
MSRKARVLFPFVGDTFGGSHVSTLLLIDELRDSSFEPIIGVHKNGFFQHYLDEKKINWIQLPRSTLVKKNDLAKQLAQMFLNSWTLRSFLKKQCIDIVHTNDRRMHLTWLFAAKFARKKHVWHHRTASSSRRYAHYAKFSDAFVTISRYCARPFSNQLGDAIQVVQDPVDCSVSSKLVANAREIIVAQSGGNSDIHVVSFVANWTEQKRPLFFLRMAHRLVGLTDIPVVFAMFGDPREPIASRVYQMVEELGLAANILFMGSKTPIEPWIAASDVLVATSVREGLGRTLIEAMQLGVPVVATSDGGHREIIENHVTGSLVDQNSPEEFAQAVADTLSSKNRTQAMVSRAKSQATEKYAPSIHAQHILAIYDEILRK